MKLHESEFLGKDGRNRPTLTRTAVPGGWIYMLIAYIDRGDALESLQTTATYVPDPAAPHVRITASGGSFT